MIDNTSKGIDFFCSHIDYSDLLFPVLHHVNTEHNDIVNVLACTNNDV